MKSLNALLFAAFLALFAVGCGGSMDADVSEEEKAELNAAMEEDMQKMTGQISEKPGDPANK